MPFESAPIRLKSAQRSELEEIARSQSLPAGFVTRAKIVLLLADGFSYQAVARKLDTSAPTVAKWKKRFLEHGLDGLETHRPGQPPSKLTARLRAKILNATRRQPRDGSTHWSCRKLAQQLGISKDLVHRVWREADLRPHRLERYMASNDPDFERKAADIIALYLDPPRHAAVFCVDEKTAIQALDRRDRVLPLSPGRAERHGFEYKRNGTLSLYAALNTQTGQVQGKTAARHTSREFVDFLEQVVAGCEPEREIHIILDNLSAHKTKLVTAFLDEHPNVALHFTPTYSSWLNQVELWFSKVQRDVIARGVFTSTADLARKLRRYINAYSKDAKPFRWKYSKLRRYINAYSKDAKPFRWKYSKPSRRIRHGKTISATVH
jgi:transposase